MIQKLNLRPRKNGRGCFGVCTISFIPYVSEEKVVSIPLNDSLEINIQNNDFGSLKSLLPLQYVCCFDDSSQHKSYFEVFVPPLEQPSPS
jgi:hypothetical protein